MEELGAGTGQEKIQNDVPGKKVEQKKNVAKNAGVQKSNTSTPATKGKQSKGDEIAENIAKEKQKVKSEDVEKEAKRKAAKEVADSQGVKVIYENTKGEYFTQISFAISSEKGKKENVFTYNFN